MTLEREQEPLITATAPVGRATFADPARSLRWSALIGGVIVVTGIWLLLHALGLGIGLTALDPQDPSLRGVGIGTGIWSIIVPLIALFVGGLVVGYLAGARPTINAAIHGAVLWALATILSLLLLVWTVGGLIGGAARLSGEVVGAAGSVAMQGIAQLDDASLDSLGLTERDLLAPINQRLQATGNPTITPDQLRAAARDALRTSVRQGRLDRQIFIQSIAEQTPLTREEAQEVATRIERQWQQGTGEISQRAQDLGSAAQQTALQAVESTGKVLLVLFFVLAVGLVAAVGGVILAASRVNRRTAARPPPATGTLETTPTMTGTTSQPGPERGGPIIT